MSRRSSYRFGVSRDAVQFVWIGVLLVAIAIVHFTGLWAAILGWAGDLLLEQINEISNTQPE